MVNGDHDTLTIRPGFLDDDDADIIQHERKAACEKNRKVSRASVLSSLSQYLTQCFQSRIKITHKNGPSTAEEK